MKNILTILEENGIVVDESVKETLVKSVSENYKTIAEVEKKDAKIKALEDKVNATEDALKKFDGVDADALNKQITELKEDLAKKDVDFRKQIADRDFNEMLKESILGAKGLNVKAITSLLDVETLKTSQNQKEDIAKAVETLKTQEDSKMLFGTEEPNPVGKFSPIGGIRRTNNNNTTLDDMYKGNPYYHPNK